MGDLRHPADRSTGNAKGVAIGDVDLDGVPDFVMTSDSARGKIGVGWFSRPRADILAAWDFHPIAQNDGVKYDLVELNDLDADGDLDVLTCEERINLGVVWYENPSRR